MNEDKCRICGGNLDGHFHVDPITFKIIYTASPKTRPVSLLVLDEIYYDPKREY